MRRNLGGIERSIRVGIGLVLLALAIFGEAPTEATITALAIGLVAAGSGLIGFCPAWKLLGINTCPMKPEDAQYVGGVRFMTQAGLSLSLWGTLGLFLTACQ